MTPAVAKALVAKAQQAVESKDTNGLLSMFSDDADIMKRNPGEFREIVDTAFSEIQGTFNMDVRAVNLDFAGGGARITFIMDLGQKNARMDAVYFPNTRIIAHLEKARTPRWLGLYEVEEWKVKRLEADPPILPRKLDM